MSYKGYNFILWISLSKKALNLHLRISKTLMMMMTMTVLHLLWHHDQNTQRVWVTCENLMLITACVGFTENISSFTFQTSFVKKISHFYWLFFGVLCRCILVLLLTPFLLQACVLTEMLPQRLQTNRKRRARWQMRRSWTNWVNIINLTYLLTQPCSSLMSSVTLISYFVNILYCGLQEP